MIDTREAFNEYLARLEPDDVWTAVALHELVRRADDGGRAERGIWIASVLERYEESQLRYGAAGTPPSASGRNWPT